MPTEILFAVWKAAERWGEPSQRAAAIQHILPRPIQRLRTLQHDLQLRARPSVHLRFSRHHILVSNRIVEIALQHQIAVRRLRLQQRFLPRQVHVAMGW